MASVLFEGKANPFGGLTNERELLKECRNSRKITHGRIMRAGWLPASLQPQGEENHMHPKPSVVAATAKPSANGADLSIVLSRMEAEMRSLLASGLNRRAIETLLASSTHVPITQIRRVLTGIMDLKRFYTSL